MARTDADRDLLFGLLALQNGFIDRDALVAAFTARARDEGRPIAGILMDRDDLSPARRTLLEALVEEHVVRHGGDPKRSLAALSGPGTAGAALAALGDGGFQASLARVGADRPESRSSSALSDTGDGGGERTVTIGACPTADGRFGVVGTSPATDDRFGVLRPLARGGLGEVHVARDHELGREVALKQIQGRYADDPDGRARFLLEAEVTGNLEHPGVVPVYSLGRDAAGRPFYAMRLIRGESLKDAVARAHAAGAGPLETQQLLRRFLGVCDAVAYAHSRGVLHRDIKPQNVMVGDFGETLVVDWGLAKVVGVADP